MMRVATCVEWMGSAGGMGQLNIRRREHHTALAEWCGFFFSSRRRHTRLQGDWSSDVCSSDLNRWNAVSLGFLGEIFDGKLLLGRRRVRPMVVFADHDER